MILSKNENSTVKQFPTDKYLNLKKPMFYVLTGSLFLTFGMQAAIAEVCAPDQKYLLPRIHSDYMKSEIDFRTLDYYIHTRSGNDGDASIRESIHGNEDWIEGVRQHPDPSRDWESDAVLVRSEADKQLKCVLNGGHIASSSTDFDVNGNYTGSIQQASNKKSKSGKGNNQVQVATADSNGNGTNTNDSNNAEASDAKSKGKEFAKNDNRLRADACVSVINKKNQLYGPAFKNICSYPIEVIWCANSKEDPNQCDRGWFNESSIGVGKSEPINAVYKTTHFVFSACHGVGSIFHTSEMDKKKEYRCVHWNE